MAQYNTALGVLPSPKTQLFGGNAGDEAQQVKRAPVSQQGQAPQAQGATQTFAQMQQQGQARPAPPVQQAMAPDQGGGFASLFGGGGTSFRQPTIQDRITRQSAFATPESVAFSIVQNERGGVRQVAPGVSAQAGTVVTQDGRQMVAGPGGLRPYDEAAREQEVLALVGRGEVPGTREYEIRQQLLQDGNVLNQLRGIFSLADQQAAAARQAQQPTAADTFQQELIAQLRQFGADGGAFDTPAARQLREARRAELEAKFQGEASALNEEMARRGIFASSIAGGRLGDIAGQQARAIASMEAEMAMESQKQAQENRRFFLEQMGELSQQMSSGELERSKLTLQERQVNADIDYRAKELQQEAMLKGRELDLQSARDLATKEYQSGQLQLGYSEMGSRERISGQELASRQQIAQQEISSRERISQQEFDLRRLLQQQEQQFQRGESALERQLRETLQGKEQSFQAGQSQLERDLRQKMQTAELSAAEKRQLAQIDADRAAQARQFGFQREESALERTLREKMQTTELTAAEKRQLAQFEADKAAQERQFVQNAMDRALRERFGMTEATGILYGPDGKPVIGADGKPVQTLAGQQFTASQTQAQNQFLAQLATVLAPMSQKDREAFIRNLPPNVRSLFGQSASGVSSPGGGTYTSGQGDYGNIVP